MDSRKQVLLIEDDDEVRKKFKERFGRYERDGELQILEAADAGEALALLFPKAPAQGPDAIILDIILPYRKAVKALAGRSDPNGDETGLRILRRLRDWEKDYPLKGKTWVAASTARNNPRFLQEITDALDGCGRIYLKPFNDFDLVDDLVKILGIVSRVNPVFLSRRTGVKT